MSAPTVDTWRRGTRLLVRLADTLTADYDLVEFLDALVADAMDLFGASGAGILLVDPYGTPQLMAAASAADRALEMVQLHTENGPCLDAIRSSEPTYEPELRANTHRWPAWAPAAVAAGIASVYATPLTLRQQTIGAFNLFGDRPAALGTDELALLRALTDVATVGILHERVHREAHVVTEQLQTALTSRVVLEQARGLVAGRLGLTLEEAYRVLRAHSRNTNTKLTVVAHAVVDGSLAAEDLPRASAAP